MFKHLASFLALATFATPAKAGDCDGTGALLTLQDTVGLGEFVTAFMHADAPATTVMLFASTGPGPTNGGSYGTLCLDAFPPRLPERRVGWRPGRQ
ncbi:MAG: hypothetical protein EXS13_11210 [Planctomycetes bacterium]|nr:hypothetical protein [Planctomycetota bacterium]